LKIYYDTEFIEDGRTIDLISIGMVAEDGRELYAVNDGIAENPLYDRICHNQWLMKNVVPHLPLRTRTNGRKDHGRRDGIGGYNGYFNLDMDSNQVMPYRMIRNAVRDFIRDTPDVELWAWYGAYDHVALAQLFGRMDYLPDGIPMWTNDLKQEAHRLGDPDLPEQTGELHHALADARHLKARAEWLAARA